MEAHELFPLITLIEGRSVEPKVVKQVTLLHKEGERGKVVLGSDHSKPHVLAELKRHQVEAIASTRALKRIVDMGIAHHVVELDIAESGEECFDRLGRQMY